MLHVSGLVPARFLCLISHLILSITLLMSKQENIKACLPLEYTEDMMYRKETELTAGLGVAIGLMGIEMIGFLAGLSMFSPTQALVSICSHATATVSLAYMMLDLWDCSLYWVVFSLCSCIPATIEVSIMIGVVGLKKPI
ncbi:transmembrane protein 107 isoform X1 [Eurytemora carolleeae]|uniref:transmembrane protein 107 isoform X1 n=1 Tax=Eurytemora carolleeae TaxID=1294199 RepID=UPI000C775FD6|nr:transmembrane protein 107 isoform X1 [Eurytemora carolleeae]|eukprot:XP_023344059.1 transmembrane protein 107-like isoform X1 [Eurytemora affinis]